MFVSQLGNEALAEELASSLIISGFDEDLGTIPLQILSLELRSVYTTNQDNVYEKCCERFGRPVVTITEQRDLWKAKPGDRLLYNFHGALGVPGSIVFTASQYKKRMAEASFLDIRLRSDLLAKTLFFVGYSFRDANVHALFRMMQGNFGDQLPGSYLVAYRWTESLDELCGKYGVTCINPAACIDGPSGDPGVDLERFLQALSSRALALHLNESMETFLDSKTPEPIRAVIRDQVVAAKKAAFSELPAAAIRVFRGAFDLAVIPEKMQPDVVDSMVEICRRAAPELANDIVGALFNLEVDLVHRVATMAACLTLANKMPRSDGFDLSLMVANFPPELLPLAACGALELLEAWEMPVAEGFWSRSSMWFDDVWEAQPEQVKAHVGPVVDRAWGQRRWAEENPISRARRIHRVGWRGIGVPSFSACHAKLISTLPKRFGTPHGE